MSEDFFMQLLALLLLLLSSGKNSDFKQIEPILNSLGGDAAETLKHAEELSGVISAMQSFSAPPSKATANQGGGFVGGNGAGGGGGEGYPLAPIAPIADDRITYALSRYIATGE